MNERLHRKEVSAFKSLILAPAGGAFTMPAGAKVVFKAIATSALGDTIATVVRNTTTVIKSKGMAIGDYQTYDWISKEAVVTLGASVELYLMDSVGKLYKVAGTGVPLTIPAGFGWTPPVNIYKNGAVYSTDYNPTPFLIEGDVGVTTLYVDADTGNNANPGTSGSPKKTLYAATAGRVNKLLIKARGTFYRERDFYIQTGHDNLCIEAWGGAPCILTTEKDPAVPLVWTDQTGGVWSAVVPVGVNASHNCYFGTNVETLARLTPVANIAAVAATPGSFCMDYSSGSRQFVRTTSGASPATGHTLYGHNGAGADVAFNTAAFDQRIGFYGLSFYGGDAALKVTGNDSYVKRLDLVNCAFKHANNFGALHAVGACTIVLYGSTASPSVFDGFSYSTVSGSAGGTVPNIVEINCTGRNSGWVSTGANQGSTTHFTGKAVRVNSQYYNNADDQVADVGASTRAWMLGSTLGPKGVGSGKSGVQAGNDGTDVRIWLDGCTFTGLDYDVSAASGATIYHKNMPAPSVNPLSTGTITTY